MNVILMPTKTRRDTVDEEVAEEGKSKSERINLGLTLLSVAAKPGASFTIYDIAAWCGCTDQAVKKIQDTALMKLRNAFQFGNERHQTMNRDLRHYV